MLALKKSEAFDEQNMRIAEPYQINNEITYAVSPYITKNKFIDEKAEDRALPIYEEIRDQLPKPFWAGHEDVVSCYDFAWRTAFGNLKKADDAVRLISNYIDTAFHSYLFMWDSSFIVMFGKYASSIFNFQNTLNNFYHNQHKDGFICRQLFEKCPGEVFTRHDPSSTGPNIMPWAEWEYYLQTGDTERLAKVFNPLLAYHLWLKEHRTWRDGTYWSSGWGCGMDNQPRLQEGYHNRFSHGHMIWMDTCMQQVLSAKILVQMAETLREENDGIAALREEIEHLTSVINDRLWCEGDSYYYDMYKDGTLNGVKSVGAYWALLADVVPKDRLADFIAHLDNPAEFNRPVRVPTLSADHAGYIPNGGYWCGSVWAPTNYMVLKGLEKHGYHGLSFDIAKNCLENVVAVYNKTNTLWENYASESIDQPEKSLPNMVGWSGLFPISILLEYVFGIRPYAREKKIVWYVNLTEEHGVKDYPLGSARVDLLCKKRNAKEEEPMITVHSSERITVEVHYGERVKIIEA